MSKALVTLTDGLQATIKTRNHVFYADEPLDSGGTDTMATPMEMAMGALGSCIAITVKLYAQRKGWPLDGIDVEVQSQRHRANEYPGYEGDETYVHEIKEKITLYGDLTDSQRERIMEIAGKCPVHRLISTPSFWIDELIAAEEAGEITP